MKTLNKILLLGTAALSLSLAGCKEHRDTISYFKNEKAEVDKKYVPSHTEIKSIPVYNGRTVSINSMSVTCAEQWNISFYGKVSFKFNNKELFEKFELGEYVKITYFEFYSDTYEDRNKDKEKELIDRQVRGYQFIGVEKLK